MNHRYKKKSWWIVFLLALGAFQGSAFCDEPPDQHPETLKALASSKEWHRLMHYRHRYFFWNLRSEVDGPDFFFAKEGKTDPLAELKASIEAFSKNLKIGRLEQHPQCAFPARYRFLKQKLNLKIPNVSCQKFDEYLKTLNPESVAVVFSSAYPNNPASMFGHIFLKVNSKRNLEKGATQTKILDYGISYAAAVSDDENPFAFIFFGVAGGYSGIFSLLPYYVKVNEYSNAESRDLWEYELNFTPEQTWQFLAHIWEIETNSYFDYFFFDENCAYQILTLIEAARPDWEVAGNPLFVIPAETVKALVHVPGAIRNITYRPSFYQKMLYRFQRLNAAERKDFFQIRAGEKSPKSLDNLNTLEATTSYFAYEKYKNTTLSENDQTVLTTALIRRSQLGNKTESVDEDQIRKQSTTQPDLGHNPTQFGYSVGWDKGSNERAQFFQELQFRFAYHDLLNNDLGFTRFSQVEFPGARIRLKSGNLRLERLNLLEVTSLFPLSFLEKRWSWKFLADYYSPKDFGCPTCHALRLGGGGGASYGFFNQKAITYLLFLANGELGTSFDQNARIVPKILLGTIANPVAPYKIKLDTSVNFDLFQSTRGSHFYEVGIDQSFSLGKSFDIRNTNQTWFFSSNGKWVRWMEFKINLNHYF